MIFKKLLIRWWCLKNHVKFLWFDRAAVGYRFKRWLFSRCPDCGRPLKLLGQYLPGHDDCIPF